MNFPKNQKWFSIMKLSDKKQEPLNQKEVEILYDKAKNLYQKYVDSQELDEIQQMLLKSGTRKDRFNSYINLTKENPLLSLSYLEIINELLESKQRMQIDALQCAVTLYGSILLPNNRLLIPFGKQPLKNTSDRTLVLFYFEDRLKKLFREFIKKLEKCAFAKQEVIRSKAIYSIGDILKNVAENDRVLLEMLVNKFGDPLSNVSKVAQKVLNSVLREHPAMSGEVCKAIKARLDGFNEVSRKRALKFIGGITIEKGGDVANDELLNIIKTELIPALNNPDESNNKVLKSLSNAAEKLSSSDLHIIVEPLYNFISRTSFSQSFYAIKLLYKAVGSSPGDKYYETLFNFVSNPEIHSCSWQPKLLDFMLEVLLNEKNEKIVCIFIHKFLQIGLHMQSRFTASILYLCHIVVSKKPGCLTMLNNFDMESETAYNFAKFRSGVNTAYSTFPWILSLYVNHYNPSIARLGQLLFSNEKNTYDSDPYTDFALTETIKRLAGNNEGNHEFINEIYTEFDNIPNFEQDDD